MKLLLGILFFAGLVYYQIKLSRNKSKYYGLILPTLCLILSLSYSFVGTPVNTEVETTEEVEMIDGNEDVISNNQLPAEGAKIENPSSTIFLTLIYSNLTTVVFMIIYIYQRLKIRKEKQLVIMKINDL